ncbi:hypothetical protein CCHL11_09920 [Colletotrichum chlorophyti]|uniref:Uncharacterized protein n=1 Tax=Colletotrichum chlorophyti TaxID=708187 RepID=A0A1Q8RNG2_9PEZI|nr:hypothetical protein CCHL11_09920 [Colletotrichum chlorophyti]
MCVTGVGTSTTLDAPRLYSSGPGATGLFSAGGTRRELEVTSLRHCSGGFRLPILAGLNIGGQRDVTHTNGSVSLLIYALGKIMPQNL